MDPFFGFGALAVFVGGAVAAAYARDRASGEDRFARSLSEATEKRTADLRDGDVAKVKGTVVLVGETKSPLSDRPCAAYSIVIQVPAPDIGWLTLTTEARAFDFLLTDDSGSARVDTSAAQVKLADASVIELDTPAARVHADYLAMKANVTLPKDARVIESILGADTEAVVVGYANREPDPDRRDGGTYRARATRGVLSGRASAPLRIKAVRTQDKTKGKAKQ